MKLSTHYIYVKIHTCVKHHMISRGFLPIMSNSIWIHTAFCILCQKNMSSCGFLQIRSKPMNLHGFPKIMSNKYEFIRFLQIMSSSIWIHTVFCRLCQTTHMNSYGCLQIMPNTLCMHMAFCRLCQHHMNSYCFLCLCVCVRVCVCVCGGGGSGDWWHFDWKLIKCE